VFDIFVRILLVVILITMVGGVCIIFKAATSDMYIEDVENRTKRKDV